MRPPTGERSEPAPTASEARSPYRGCEASRGLPTLR